MRVAPGHGGRFQLELGEMRDQGSIFKDMALGSKPKNQEEGK